MAFDVPRRLHPIRRAWPPSFALTHVQALGWTKDHIDDMLFYGVLGVVIGGRLGEVFFYNASYYLAHPSKSR